MYKMVLYANSHFFHPQEIFVFVLTIVWPDLKLPMTYGSASLNMCHHLEEYGLRLN